MALVRKQFWDTDAFHTFLLERAKEPFHWGVNDCSLFCADGILSFTGVDIAADFRGYTDEAGAWQSIKDVCGGTTVADAAAYCANKHGLVEWHPYPKMAQRGDLVVFEGATGLVSGLVHLSGQIVAVGENGLYKFPISKVLRAWKV